jgi:hypothetical protein
MRNLLSINLKKSVLAVAGLCLVSQLTFAMPENLTYKNFRAHGVLATNSTGNSFSGGASWNPSYAINSKFDVRGFLGIAPLKGEDETFMMSEFGVMAAYDVLPTWEVEVGAGMQSWSGQDTSPMIAANVIKTLSEPYMGIVDGLYAGYSMVSHDEAASVFKLGVTISFGKGAATSEAATETK